MATTIQRWRIRILVDQLSNRALISSTTSANPAMWRNADVQFEIGLAYGTEIADVSNLNSVTVQVKPYATPTANPLMNGTTTVISNTLTTDTWQDGSDQHAVIQFAASETNLDLAGTLSKGFWLVVGVTTSGSPVLNIPVGIGMLTVKESGWGSETWAQASAPRIYCSDNLKTYQEMVLLDESNNPYLALVETTEPASSAPRLVCAANGVTYSQTITLIDGVPTVSLVAV